MFAGPLCLEGKVGGGNEAMGSSETVFTFPQPSPEEAGGSAEAEQRAGGTARALLFAADKIKDACVAALRRGRHGVLGSSNCLLLLSLQAYCSHLNAVETKIFSFSIFYYLWHPNVTPKVSAAISYTICTRTHVKVRKRKEEK